MPSPEASPEALPSPSTVVIVPSRADFGPPGARRPSAELPIVMFHYIGPLPPNPDIFRKDLGRFLMLAAVAGLPLLLVSLPSAPRGAGSPDIWLAFALQALLGFIVQGAIVYGAFQEMRGQSFIRRDGAQAVRAARFLLLCKRHCLN